MSARHCAVGGSVSRRTAPWFRIHHAERRVGQARHLVIAFPFERRLRLCDPQVATANSSWELTVGSSSGDKRVARR
jgi:hypothetical protein